MINDHFVPTVYKNSIEELVAIATEDSELKYLQGIHADIKSHRFNFKPGWLLCVKKMACGHWEIFQTPYSLKSFDTDCLTQKCSRCVVGNLTIVKY